MLKKSKQTLLSKKRKQKASKLSLNQRLYEYLESLILSCVAIYPHLSIIEVQEGQNKALPRIHENRYLPIWKLPFCSWIVFYKKLCAAIPILVKTWRVIVRIQRNLPKFLLTHCFENKPNWDRAFDSDANCLRRWARLITSNLAWVRAVWLIDISHKCFVPMWMAKREKTSIPRALYDSTSRYVNMHSNKICIVGIAFGHKMLQNHETCTSIEYLVCFYSISWGIIVHRRIKSMFPCWIQPFRERRKREAFGWRIMSPFAKWRLTRATNTHSTGMLFRRNTFWSPSCMRGRVIEINKRILENPSLLTSKVCLWWIRWFC